MDNDKLEALEEDSINTRPEIHLFRLPTGSSTCDFRRKGQCRQAVDFANDEQRYPNMQEATDRHQGALGAEAATESAVEIDI